MSGRTYEVGAAHGAAPRTAEELTRALRGRWQGAYGTAKCPAHEDRAPSLSLADGTTGRVLVKCHAGCTFESVRAVLRRDGLWPGRVPGLSKPRRVIPERGADVAPHFRKYPPDVGGLSANAGEPFRKSSGTDPEEFRNNSANPPARGPHSKDPLPGTYGGTDLPDGDGMTGRGPKGLAAVGDTLAAPALASRAWTTADERRVARVDGRSAYAQELWRRAAVIDGTPAERYLRGRGITAPLPSSLRYLDDCPHPSRRRFPAMLAKVAGTEGFAVHRTFLMPDGSGKAPLAPNKAMLGPTRGGAVRLGAALVKEASPKDWELARARLVVTEGIETGLSIATRFLRSPVQVWAALSTSGMAGLTLPPWVGELAIGADGDEAGWHAARKLASRAKRLGWTVYLTRAPQGQDWNDVLQVKVSEEERAKRPRPHLVRPRPSRMPRAAR